MNKIAKQTVRSGKGTNGKFLRGNRYSKGRKKGSKDKFTDLKKSFLEAFEKTGGIDGLVKWIEESKRNRAIFYQMITKLFPLTVEHEGKIEHKLKFDFDENSE